MTVQTLSYSSSCNFQCGTSLPAPVIMCVPHSFVAPYLCQPEPIGNQFYQTYNYGFIAGSIIAKSGMSSSCGRPGIWDYTLQYDDTSLNQGVTLTSANILGMFCDSCLTNWVRDIVGADPYISLDDVGNPTFVSPHGCTYPITQFIPDYGSVAALGSSITDAAQIYKHITRITVDQNGRGVKLPPAGSIRIGEEYLLYNDSTRTYKIYGYTASEYLAEVAGNTGITIAPHITVRATVISSTVWAILPGAAV